MTIPLQADIENVDWNPLNKYKFLSSYDNGNIELFDIRNLQALLNFPAHKKAATSVSFSYQQEGLFSSVGLDSHVKLWDSDNLLNGQDGTVYPSLICEKFVKKTTVFFIF